MASTGEASRTTFVTRLPDIHLSFVVGLPTLIAALCSVALYDYTPVDWRIARAGGWAVMHGELDLYARLPMVQMGPLSLVIAPLPRWLYMAVVVAGFGWLLWQTRRRDSAGRLLHLATGVILAPLFAYLASTGHADEAIVIWCMVLAPVAVAGRDERGIAVLVAVAVAAKPTALLLLPLALMVSRRAAAMAFAAGAVAYLPFLMADFAGFLGAGRGFNDVQNGSLADWLGYSVGAEYPAWIRPLQLLGAWVIVWVVGRRRGLAVGLVAALVWRAVLEPGPWGSYSLPVMIAALLLASAPAAALIVVAGFASWLAVFHYPQADWQGAARVGLLLVMAALAWRAGGQAPVHRAATRAPSGSPRAVGFPGTSLTPRRSGWRRGTAASSGPTSQRE